jgi:RNA polymerase sigma factor (sigma-70 family)
MTAPGAQHELEELLAGARWVRGLARGLVRDAASADDVSQDAWVAALTRPAQAREPRAWLAGVVRHLSRREARSQERRRARELATARPERVPSAAELVERSELQERLSSAVRALEEPYRSTVLLHYAEGLTLEQIASLQGVPSSTVRTRLARALERLRARLDREHGGRATWLAALAPLTGVREAPLAPAAAGATLWSLAMGTKTALGIAALAVAVVLVAVSMRMLERRPVEPVAVIGAEVLDAVTVAPESPPTPGARVEVTIETAAPEVSSATSTELQCSVSGHVLDHQGGLLPASANAHVRFVDELGISHSVKVEPDGTYAMDGLAPGRWWLMSGPTGWLSQEAVLDLGESVPSAQQDFRLLPRPSVTVKLLAPDGRSFWEAAKPFDLGRFGFSTAAVATLEPPGERFEGVRGSLNNRFGIGAMWFDGQGSVELPADTWCRVYLHAELPLYLSLVLYHDVIETQRIEAGQEEAVFTLDPASIADRLGGVEFTIVDDATGEPIAGTSVMLQGKGGSGPSFVSDVAGRVHIEKTPAGLHDLRIEAPDRASVRREVDVPRGQVLDLGTIELTPAVPIRGRAVGSDGAGLDVEIRVCAVPEPGELPKFGNHFFGSEADGSFEIADLAPGRWLLQVKDEVRGRLQGNAAEQMAPHVLVDTRSGPVEDLVVQLERVAFVVASWQGDDFEGLRMRFFDPDGLLRQVSGFFSTAPMRVALFPGGWRVVVVDAQGTTLTERAFTLSSEPLRLDLASNR